MMHSSKVLRLLKSSLKSPRIYHAQWMLTRNCNYRCKSCNVWTEQDPCELSTEDIKKGLDILRDLGVLEIVLSGGNPLLRKDIGEILDYASRYFITTVYDNGSIAARKVKELQKVDFVAISLDTLDEEKQDFIKGVPGAWKKAMESIEKLKKSGIHVGVSPTISQFNLHEVIDFSKYFVERSIPVWYCLYWHDHPFKNRMFSIGKKNEAFEITDYKAIVKVFDELLKMREESRYIYITKKTLKALRRLVLTGERCWKCKALENFMVIDHLGRVAGCHNREPVTSIFELPILWRRQKFIDLREEYRQCDKCSYLCYIFYSLHTGISGILEILRDQWKNATILLSDASTNKYDELIRER